MNRTPDRWTEEIQISMIGRYGSCLRGHLMVFFFPFFLLNGSGMILAFGALACSLHLKTEGL